MKAYHNSHLGKYRSPYGAVPVGGTVKLRLDVADPENDLNCFVRIWHDVEGLSLIPMKCLSWGSTAVFTADYTVPGEPCLIWYSFIMQRFPDRYFYGNNDEGLGGEGRNSSNAPKGYQITVYEPTLTPEWYREGIAYQIFPDRFKRGADWLSRQEAALLRPGRKGPRRILRLDWNDDPIYERHPDGSIARWDFFGGTLDGIREKLLYLKSFGVTAIYLNPIFEAASNHKYDTADYMRIDPMFGDEKSFRTLTGEAARLGIRIILDGVFSHTGADSRYFDIFGNYAGEGAKAETAAETAGVTARDSSGAAVADDPAIAAGSGEADPAIAAGSGEAAGEAAAATHSLYVPGAAQSGDSPYFKWYRFRNWPGDYECWWGVKDLPNVNELEPGYADFITGSKGVLRHWMKLGAGGWRLDVADELPDEFIAMIRKTMKDSDRDSVLLGEVWEDASNKISYDVRRRYLLGRELDSVMNYPFRDAGIAFFLERIDARRLTALLLNQMENYPREAFYSNLNLISSHDRERALTLLGEAPPGDSLSDNDKKSYRLPPGQRALGIRRLKALSLLQFTLPGVPCIYYGDEAGLEGYRDPYNRRTYPWGGEDQDLIYHYRVISTLRKQHPVFARGDFEPLNVSESVRVRYDDAFAPGSSDAVYGRPPGDEDGGAAGDAAGITAAGYVGGGPAVSEVGGTAAGYGKVTGDAAGGAAAEAGLSAYRAAKDYGSATADSIAGRSAGGPGPDGRASAGETALYGNSRDDNLRLSVPGGNVFAFVRDDGEERITVLINRSADTEETVTVAICAASGSPAPVPVSPGNFTSEPGSSFTRSSDPAGTGVSASDPAGPGMWALELMTSRWYRAVDGKLTIALPPLGFAVLKHESKRPECATMKRSAGVLAHLSAVPPRGSQSVATAPAPGIGTIPASGGETTGGQGSETIPASCDETASGTAYTPAPGIGTIPTSGGEATGGQGIGSIPAPCGETAPGAAHTPSPGSADLSDCIAFLDFLKAAGFKIWQVLPITPTGLGNSPYASPGAFAGNTDYIDRSSPAPEDEAAYEAFCLENSYWLDDYALFKAIKTRHPEAWQDWPEAERTRSDIKALTEKYREAFELEKREQFWFWSQWYALRHHARDLGISIIGDMPLGMSEDSADVWAHPEIFELDEDGRARLTAGVPPDYYNGDGQNWGTPVYDWAALEKNGYDWWIRRFKHAFKTFDYVRLDHFRGFSEYYSIPRGKSAAFGGWRNGPGLKFFETLKSAYVNGAPGGTKSGCNDAGPGSGSVRGLPIIAEDLGNLDAGVRNLLAETGLPGMDVYEFEEAKMLAATPEEAKTRIYYSSTHDSQTLVGWCLERCAETGRTAAKSAASGAGEAVGQLSSGGSSLVLTDNIGAESASGIGGGVPRTADGVAGAAEAGSDYAAEKLTEAKAEAEKILDWLYASDADWVIVSLQDILGLDDSARFNTPGTLAGGNWSWRAAAGILDKALAGGLRETLSASGRC